MTKKTLFSLLPPPTFDLTVQIPLPGADPMPLKLTFKHRGRIELGKFMDEAKNTDDDVLFRRMVVGWELEDELNEETATTLIDKLPGAALAAYRSYLDALMGLPGPSTLEALWGVPRRA
jgi:hypothetical protein